MTTLPTNIAGAIHGNDSPWNIARHLPESNEPEELRRCFNLVWQEFYVAETAAQQAATNINDKLNQTSSSNAAQAADVPPWTKHLTPPFAVLACNTNGSTLVDQRGYGVLLKVL
jgi:hypothetical protein